MTAERRMQVGVVLPIAEEDGRQPGYAEIRDIGRAIERAGLDSVWVFDHLLYRDGPETSGIHEAWTILAAIAEATTSVQLGTIVMATSFRNPALLAKMAATLDEVSGGRLILGLGCGWHDPEYEAFGYPTDHRVGRFEEALAIITDLIRTGRADLDGRWHTVRDCVLLPPAPRPELPILVAAKRPRMLDLAARHADAWNTAWYGLPDERLAANLRNVREACSGAGRDPDSLVLTVGLTIRGAATRDEDRGAGSIAAEPAAIAEALAAYDTLGFEHIICSLEPTTPAMVERLAAAVGHWRPGIG
jgi:probable F420-dependent oxidoreductase